MIGFLKLLAGALPVFYAFTFALYLNLLLAGEEEKRRSLATWALAITCLFHLGMLTVRGFVLGHCPLSTGWEIVSFLAASLGLIHLMVQRISGFVSPGVPVVGLSLFLQTLSSSFFRYELVVSPVLRKWQVPLHAVLGILGHAGFFTSACYCFLFLMLYRLIKVRRIGEVWEGLPPLETMYRMSKGAILFGIAFLLLSILTGLWQTALRGLAPRPLISSGTVLVVFSGLLLFNKVKRISAYAFTWGAAIAAVIDLVLLFTTETLHRQHFQ